MNRDQVFEIWSPPPARWSPWVKPVLFSFISDTAVLPGAPRGPPAWDMTGLPTARENVALVLDLPGGEATRLGMTFLTAGFRPVPVYNALPWVEGSGFLLANDHPPMVNMIDVVEALRAATPELAKAQLPADAPPAFLLDASRRKAVGPALPGSFDNRWVCFPTDFPSANFLLGCGIQRVVVVVSYGDVESDLAHTLRQWQDVGMRIELKRLEEAELPRPIEVPKPTWYRSLIYRALELMDFRKSKLGGFGGILPEPSSSG